jgi:hypothetical protein
MQKAAGHDPDGGRYRFLSLWERQKAFFCDEYHIAPAAPALDTSLRLEG